MWNLNFITRKNLKKHVKETIKEYGDNLKSVNLDEFNSNKIDPIKLLFDSKVYKKTYDEIVNDEIVRQRDKSNNNAIRIFSSKNI